MNHNTKMIYYHLTVIILYYQPAFKCKEQKHETNSLIKRDDNKKNLYTLFTLQTQYTRISMKKNVYDENVTDGTSHQIPRIWRFERMEWRNMGIKAWWTWNRTFTINAIHCLFFYYQYWRFIWNSTNFILSLHFQTHCFSTKLQWNEMEKIAWCIRFVAMEFQWMISYACLC